MAGFFAIDFWPEDFWPEYFWGDQLSLDVVLDDVELVATGTVPMSGWGLWAPNFWTDTFWVYEFWSSDPNSESEGTIAEELGGVTAALVGDYNAPAAAPRNGILNASLSGVTASVGGTIAYITNFEVEVGVSANWQFFDLPVVDGTIAATLDDLTGSLSGLFWDQSYTDGFIGPTETLWAPMFWDWRLFPDGYWPKTAVLEDLTASFAGTFGDAPGSNVGVLVASLEALTASLEGRFTERQQFNGQIAASLGGVTATLVGDTERPVFSGSVAGALDGITSAITGLFTPAGSFNGRLAATFSGVTGRLIGDYNVPTRTGTIATALSGITAYGRGLSLPDGAKLGQFHVILAGVDMAGSGTFVTPRLRARTDTPTVTEIDWKTLCDQHNQGLPDDVDYEFSSGRRFYQR